MKRIGMFYGSDGGYTENVCQRLITHFGEDKVDLIDVFGTNVDEISAYDYLIFASST